MRSSQQKKIQQPTHSWSHLNQVFNRLQLFQSLSTSHSIIPTWDNSCPLNLHSEAQKISMMLMRSSLESTGLIRPRLRECWSKTSSWWWKDSNLTPSKSSRTSSVLVISFKWLISLPTLWNHYSITSCINQHSSWESNWWWEKSTGVLLVSSTKPSSSAFKDIWSLLNKRSTTYTLCFSSNLVSSRNKLQDWTEPCVSWLGRNRSLWCL